MSAENPTIEDLPIDPAFPPETYDRMARLLEVTAVVFFLLALIGFVARLVQDWAMPLSAVIHREPRSWYWTPEAYFSNLFAFNPSSVILLGVAVMMVAVIGRSVISAIGLYRAQENVLASITVSVVTLIAIAFLLARYGP